MKKQQFKSTQVNKGVALPVALIFLLVLTVLGVSSLGTNVFEEKMAANSLNRELAFQAAEATLREGERHVEATSDIFLQVFYDGGSVDPNGAAPPNDGDVCINAYCTPTHQDAVFDPAKIPGDSGFLYDRWIELDTSTDPNNLQVWSTTGRHIEYTNFNALGLNSAPKYIIEFLGHWVPPSGSACDGVDADLLPDAPNDVWPYCPNDPGMYRITALAETAAGARVMLQSTYRK